MSEAEALSEMYDYEEPEEDYELWDALEDGYFAYHDN